MFSNCGVTLALIISCWTGRNVVPSAAVMSETPVNTVAPRGGQIRAYCMSSDRDDRVEFTHHTDSGNFTVYDNGSVSRPQAPEAQRYRLTYEHSDSLKRAVLEITPVVPSDAGTFSCKTNGTYYYFELTIVKGVMSCRNNLTKSIVREDDLFEFSCTIVYYGNCQPQLEWSGPSGKVPHRRRLSLPSSYDGRSWSSGKTFVSIQTRAHRSLHSYVYRCVASYPVPTGPAWADGARASNVPTSGPEYRSDPLVVYYPPGLSIRPRHRLYGVGESLTIMAWSRPAAHRYVWLDKSTGERHSGARLVISAVMAGANNLTCFAFNRIFGIEYNGSIQFNFEVFESEVAITTLREDMKNTVARSGEMIQLHCTLPSRNASVIFREFAKSPTGTVVGVANWTHATITHRTSASHFRVFFAKKTSDWKTSRRFTMEISRVTFDDVGWYCCDIHLADGRGPTYCAQVGVLDSQDCGIVGVRGSQVVEGDVFSFFCSLRFAGVFLPSHIWSDPDGKPLEDSRQLTNPGNGGSRMSESYSNVRMVANRTMHGRRYTCTTRMLYRSEFLLKRTTDLNPPQQGQLLLAENSPGYTLVYNAAPLTVLYPPSVRTDPITELVSVGIDLKVIADARPPAYGHRCFDFAANETYSGRKVALTEVMLGHHFFYCSAFNTIRGVTHRGNTSYAFTVLIADKVNATGLTEDQLKDILKRALFGVAFLVICVITMVVLRKRAASARFVRQRQAANRRKVVPQTKTAKTRAKTVSVDDHKKRKKKVAKRGIAKIGSYGTVFVIREKSARRQEETGPVTQAGHV